MAAGALDTELTALVWLLLDGGVPLVVAGRGDLTDRRDLLGALLELPPAGSVHLVLDELVPGAPSADDVERALAAVRAIQHGVSLATTVTAESLEDVFAVLGAPPLALAEDEVRTLGVVLVVDGGARARVVAAHYLRPLERDMHGHLQRRPPAVLATWEPRGDRFEHFAWGVTPELAQRVGRTQADFEERQVGRARFLEHLGRGSDVASADLAGALRDFRMREEPPPAPLRAGRAHDHHSH